MFYWFMRRGVFLTSLIEGGAQERGKRAGTENIPAIMGMAAALEEACGRIDSTSARVSALRDRLIAGLLAIPHAALNGDAVHRLPGNVNFCFEGIEVNPCCFCWMTGACTPPPAPLIQAMCCWPLEGRTRSPMAPCG